MSTFYRLNSAVDHASDQGVIPHLLVVAALNSEYPDSWVLAGVDLWFDGDETKEVDIFGVYGEGKVVAGEIKTKASQFDKSQLERDVALSVRLRADTHLMAAVDEISVDLRSAAKQLCDEAGVELLVLDKKQLRPTQAPS